MQITNHVILHFIAVNDNNASALAWKGSFDVFKPEARSAIPMLDQNDGCIAIGKEASQTFAMTIQS